MELSTAIAIASFILSAASMIWIGGFRFSALIHEVQSLKENVQDIKGEVREIRQDVKEIRADLHKIDIRVSVLEQRK